MINDRGNDHVNVTKRQKNAGGTALSSMHLCRVPTVMENPGKKVVMESHGKVMENCEKMRSHGILFFS